MRSLAAVFAAVYWSVLVAELIGDKSICSVTTLALRFRRAIVMTAVLVAYSVKMACAVLIGGLLLRLPIHALTVASALGFIVAALVMILRGEDEEEVTNAGWRSGALASFTSLFMTEWLDPGQMVTITAITARPAMPLVVWAAASAAMVSKGTLALLFGVKLRALMPQRMLRVVAAISLASFGVIALFAR